MKIVFVDSVAPAEYNLDSEGVGGTEQTVIRVGRALREYGYEVEISNKPRIGTQTIVLRDPYQARNGGILWMHDYCQPHEITDAHRDATRNGQVVCVSAFHQANVAPLLPEAHVKFIYNPVEADASVHRQAKRLIFASNPAKGLFKTLQVFQALQRMETGWKLFLACPGYASLPSVGIKNVYPLGTLSHDQAIREIAKAQFMLQANDVFPETFGLVYAEANAVGTPCLTYDLGAATEILGPEQAMPLGTTQAEMAQKLLEWSKTSPKVEADPRFAIETIASQWDSLLRSI